MGCLGQRGLRGLEKQMTTWLTTIFHAMSQPLKWWVVVAPWEQGIRVRLGKEAVVLNPGIHFRIPFLDRIYVQSIRLRIVTSGSLTVSTLDRKVVTTILTVRFAIRDVKLLYNTIANPETTLINHVSSLAAEYISQATSADLSHKSLSEYVDSKLDVSGWGLEEVSVNITDFAFIRAYRLMGNEYERCYGLDLEKKEHGIR